MSITYIVTWMDLHSLNLMERGKYGSSIHVTASRKAQYVQAVAGFCFKKIL